ncbi:Crp/Fnr family transcriptional regulator [Oceanobacillus halophilus]|uniref:Crp/Fnr family transcriptional regulator n=1 Tax=Oceanobacillus halophilus TaxID=930130 RepID=A0A494ZUC1_9BACI|nr:Crp/Fnr family transcriptional regulator [Oceanobacillus halophilus]RKQ29592.1 Crp/Fnr family transcriptional regulator [Oceanobacillus halophilus]
MSKSCNHDVSMNQLCVSKVPFFNHLTYEEMLKIVEMSRRLNYKKGEVIFRDGEPLEYLYIVHQGRVKNYQLFESGKEQLLRIIESGEFMGELALFTEKTLDSHAEAMEKTEICAIHRDDMQLLMQQHPTIAVKILQEFSTRLDETEKLVGNLSSKDVETRTADYLVELAKKSNSNEINLPMSKKDLASYLGTTSETISRRLSNFQTNGWIEQKGQRRIRILDKQALENISIEN